MAQKFRPFQVFFEGFSGALKDDACFMDYHQEALYCASPISAHLCLDRSLKPTDQSPPFFVPHIYALFATRYAALKSNDDPDSCRIEIESQPLLPICARSSNLLCRPGDCFLRSAVCIFSAIWKLAAKKRTTEKVLFVSPWKQGFSTGFERIIFHKCFKNKTHPPPPI